MLTGDHLNPPRRRPLRRLAAGLAAGVIGLLLLAAPPAFAQRTLVGTIPFSPFSSPQGIAIDGNDNVWITSNHTVEYNAYPSQTQIGSNNGASGNGIAIDDATNYLYETNVSNSVEVFDSTGAFTAEWPTGNSEGIATVAVDNSGGTTQGRVYIARYTPPDPLQAVKANGEPSDFSDSSAPYISANQITGTPGPGTAVVPFGALINVTTDPQGNLYLLDRANRRVDEFEPSGEFIRSFTGAGVPGGFSSKGLSALAVDPTNGDLLIIDETKNVVDVLSPSGEYIEQLTGFGGGEDLRRGIAVNSEGYVYVVNYVNSNIAIFSSDLTLPKISYGGVSEPTPTGGILNATVDPNGAGEITGCYFEYGPSAPYGGGYGSPHVPCKPATPYSSSSPQEVSAEVSGLTTETAYRYRVVVTVKEAGGREQKVNGSEQAYAPHAVKGLEAEPPTDLMPTTATINASFIGSGEPTEYYFEWGATEAYGEKTPEETAVEQPAPARTHLSAELTGLSLGAAYHYRIVATNASGTSYSSDQEFTSSGSVPYLKTESPSSIGPEGITLNGSFHSDGEEVSYYFEWGLSSSYGKKTEERAVEEPVGTTVSAAAELTGLTPKTTYHYRLVANDGFGTTYGEDETAETGAPAPLVTESVNGVQSDLALLHAKINPGGGETTYHFEYATQAQYEASHAYASRAPVPDASAGSGLRFQNVSLHLTDLQSGTTYHWRVVAQNSTATTNGPDRTFTTFSLASSNEHCPNAHVRQQTAAASLLDCRAYELVSAANTGGYDIESDLVEGQAPYPGYPEAEGPSRVLYAIHDGGVPGTDNSTNRGPDPYVATRGETGWSTEYVGVPANNPFAAAPFSSTPSGADSGLGTFAYGGPEGCSPCFAGGYTGIPVHLPNGELVQGMVASPSVPTPPPSATPDGYIAKDLSANGEHFIFGSTSEFAAGGNDETGDVSIYDRNLRTGETHVVSDTEAGTPLPCIEGAGDCRSPGDQNGIAELGVSKDGSHILLGQLVKEKEGVKFWHLYMDVDDSTHSIDLTSEVIAAHDGTGFTAGVQFDGMTSDGSKVFFTTTAALHTTANQDTDQSADIYQAEVSGQSSTLTRISTGTEATGNTDSCDPNSNSSYAHWNTTGSEANCGVVAIGGGGGLASQRGTIYFLSPEKLDGSGNGIQNAPNLYVVRPGSAPRFVSTLESSLTGPQPPLTRHRLLSSFGTGVFSQPSFFAIDNSGGPSTGDLYVADTTTNTVYKYDPSHEPVRSWGDNGRLTGFVGGISGIAVGPTGNLYVLSGSTMFKYAQDGTLKDRNPKFISGGFGGENLDIPPDGIAVDSAGNVYAIDETSYELAPEFSRLFYYEANVVKFSSSGELLGLVTSGLSATGFAFDPSDGDLYVDNGDESVVTGSGGKTIYKYSFNEGGEVIEPASTPCRFNCAPTKILPSEFTGGKGIAVDSNHDVYVDEGSQVVEFDPSGVQLGISFGSGLLIADSTGVGLDSIGDIYVGNPSHSDVAVFGPTESDPSPSTDNPAVVDSVASSEARDTADFQVSPNGEFAVFASTLPLTGFESTGHEEIYRYDSSSESLVCVSCDPTGDEPTAESELAPGGLSLTDDGRVFFTTAEPLVERDGDGRKDVYEWEAQGAGSAAEPCQTPGGCLDLISAGSSASDSSLLGASADGTDVYFFTRDKLVPQDQNGNAVKIYDARELGGFPNTPPPPLCKASDECHGASSPTPPPPNIHPNTGTSGNEVPPTQTKCRPGFVEKHGRCVKKPHNHKKKSHRRRHHRGGKK